MGVRALDSPDSVWGQILKSYKHNTLLPGSKNSAKFLTRVGTVAPEEGIRALQVYRDFCAFRLYLFVGTTDLNHE